MQFVIILLSFACLLITSVLTSTLTLDERKRIFDNMSLATKATISESNDATPSFEAVQGLICIHPSEDVILARYLLKEKLGKGTFGHVIKVKDTCDNSEWALKSFGPKLMPHQAGSFKYESQIMSILGKQDSLISFKRTLPHSKQALMPLMLGALTEKTFGKMNLETLKNIMKQVVDGVFAAHTLNIVVNDLKEENVLVESLIPPKIRLGDFGVSHDAEKRENEGRYGSPAYMPWEKITGFVKGSYKPDDIWAIGSMAKYLIFGVNGYDAMLRQFLTDHQIPSFTAPVRDHMIVMLDFFSSGFGDIPRTVEHHLLYELNSLIRNSFGTSTFHKKSKRIHNVADLLPEPFKSDQHLVSFLECCLQYDSKKRATIEELKFHPFLTS